MVQQRSMSQCSSVGSGSFAVLPLFLKSEHISSKNLLFIKHGMPQQVSVQLTLFGLAPGITVA